VREYTEGTFKPSLKERLIFLFNDCILLTRLNFEFRSLFSLGSVTASLEEISFEGQTLAGLSISNTQECIKLACLTKEEGERWIQQINDLKEEYKAIRTKSWNNKRGGKGSGADMNIPAFEEVRNRGNSGDVKSTLNLLEERYKKGGTLTRKDRLKSKQTPTTPPEPVHPAVDTPSASFDATAGFLRESKGDL
jgi:hypothetical protein